MIVSSWSSSYLETHVKWLQACDNYYFENAHGVKKISWFDT
jgi:hypothetical protein